MKTKLETRRRTYHGIRRSSIRKGSIEGQSADSEATSSRFRHYNPKHGTFIDYTNEMEHQSHPSPVSMTSNTSGLTLPGSNGSSPLTSNAIMTHSSDTLTAVNGIAQAELLSRKRSSAEQSQEGASPIEPNSKRRRVDEPVKPRTPSPTPEPMVLAEAFTTPLYDDAPKYLLQRTCALALNHVGFDSATKEAMESFSAQIDTCEYLMFLANHDRADNMQI